MHSSETVPPATGPALLQQLSRLIVRARSASPRARTPRDRHHAKGRTHPSTSTQAPAQPVTQAPKTPLENQLDTHVQVLWDDHIPVSIEVLLAPDCKECYTNLRRMGQDPSFDKPHSHHQGLLLERWTLQPLVNKSHDAQAFITSQWLLNAVRSQLHFSQLAAWLARLKGGQDDGPQERRRKLSREQCNFKKLESNCDDSDSLDDERKLNIVYSIKIPGESFKAAEFTKKPTDHTFPVTDIGNNLYLKVVLQSLPRLDDIPIVKCTCPKRRASKEMPTVTHEELVGKLNDLSLENYNSISPINSNIGTSSRRFADFFEEKKQDKILDDRMHTTCSENGKHKCNCDEESDNRSLKQETKKLDERRIKEIAKYKRRLRKECKLKKLCDSTSSEGDGLKRETHTSIPILQAARFDRLRAIGCYRNQTYLTLPASRIETKSPFVDSLSIPLAEFKKTVSVSTQTDDLSCQCGVKINIKCESCRLVRSEANYNLASLEKPKEEQLRKRKEDIESKKLQCDNFSSNLKCDNDNLVDVSNSLIKRPKLRRFLPMVGRIERVMTDRKHVEDNVQKYHVNKEDMKQLHLKTDDSVFTAPKHETKRQKTFSINDDDYVMFERCDYGTVDRFDVESPKEDSGFKFPDPKNDNSEHFGRERNSAKVFKETNGHSMKINGQKDRNGTADKNNQRDKNSQKINEDSNKYLYNLEKNNYNHCQDLKHCQVTPKVEDTVEAHDEDQKVEVPSPSEMDRFRWRFDSAASMVFHTKTGLPLTSSPAPLRRGNNCFDFDDSINGISGIKSALYHERTSPPSPPPRPAPANKLRVGSSTGLLGTFEESALKGRLEPVATVAGFTCELGASGSFCPPHRRLPVTVFFYAPGGTNAPYMGHINLGPTGYRVARSGTIQVSLFNPHGTLVKMFVVLYDLTCMPPLARTFLRQRTLYMPAGAEAPSENLYKWLRYLIHLRFMTSKSGKLYLHTDIRILVSRKADLDTATAHSALFRPIPTNQSPPASPTANHSAASTSDDEKPTNESASESKSTNRTPNRVFGGSTDFDESKMREIGYENQNGVSYELRSFTYAPENPKYSPR